MKQDVVAVGSFLLPMHRMNISAVRVDPAYITVYFLNF